MDKEDVVHIHNGTPLSHKKNEILPFVTIWVDLEDIMEKEMATHSSILAWRILWTEEPGGLQSMESQTVGHD